MGNPWEDIRKEIKKEDAEAERTAFIKAIGDMKKEDIKLADLLQQTGDAMKKEGDAKRKAKAEAEAEKKKKENAKAEKTNNALKALSEALPHY